MFKQFLIKQSWTGADMTSQWETDQDGDYVYGKMTAKRLRNTYGIKISPGGCVCISQFDQNGDWTTPRILCSGYRFVIRE